MEHLTLAGRSDDGKRLLLVSDNGAEFTLDIDAPLRAALRGDHARIGQLEIQMDSSLRPRDIQARIRGGESPEAVAQAAQTTVEKIMAFAAPVMAERSHIAGRAQGSSLRRRSGDTGARTLGEAVSAHLRGINVDPDQIDWDSWRREDGRWALTATFNTPQRKGTATFAFDLRGSFVTSEDADARWLVGDEVARTSTAAKASRDDLQQARARRLNAVPADELPLGEDAIELAASDREPGDEGDAGGDASPSETTIDLTEAGLDTADVSVEDPQDGSADSPPEDRDDDSRVDSPTGSTSDPAAAEPAARRPARKARGRASVPSWDEIMFGGPSD